MRRNFRILIEYDGTDFHGWQVQPDQRTIQGEIEKAIEAITKEKVKILGAGRTDAGVHALGQVANFYLENSPMDAEKLLGGINAMTGEDVAVHEIEEVPDAFCARTNVISKTYRYRIYNDQYHSPILQRTFLHVPAQLDIVTMNRAAKFLEGNHDFNAFRASNCTDPNPIRTLQSCGVEKKNKEVIIEVKAKGFLKNMVRIIAGTLLLAGRGKLDPDEIPRIIESGNRKKAGPTAWPHGLVLVNIVYAK